MTPDIRGSGRVHRGDSPKPSLMGIMDEMDADAFSVDAHSATAVSWKKSKSNGNTTRYLYWNDIPVRDDQHIMDVEVTVTLRPGDPMSYWRINVLNPGTKFGLEWIRFPLLNIAPIGDAKNNIYIYPRGHGGHVEDPFNNQIGVNDYDPLHFNMQFNALCNKKSGTGLYLTTQDPIPNLMQAQDANTPEHVTWKVAHLPPQPGWRCH